MIALTKLVLVLLSLLPHNWGYVSLYSAPTLYTYNKGLAFDFPQFPAAIDYLLTNETQPLGSPVTVQFTLNAQSTTVFDWQTELFNTCPVPATVRPYFEQKTA